MTIQVVMKWSKKSMPKQNYKLHWISLTLWPHFLSPFDLLISSPFPSSYPYTCKSRWRRTNVTSLSSCPFFHPTSYRISSFSSCRLSLASSLFAIFLQAFHVNIIQHINDCSFHLHVFQVIAFTYVYTYIRIFSSNFREPAKNLFTCFSSIFIKSLYF